MSKLKLTKKPTILVVDDTPDNLVMMSNLLINDYRIEIANSGEKALKIASSDSPPNLILLDIMMPDMDGYEVCQRLKRDPKTMNVPVIFLTAKTDEEDEKKGLELGAVDYITKPISPPIVLARIKNHLAIQEKSVELENAMRIAEKANLAKSSFLSSMSHELRSPLNAILGFSQLMESDSQPPTPNQQESITQILKAGWHLLTLINEILDLAKVESGHVPMTCEPVALASVLLECQGMIAPQAQEYGIRTIFPPLKNTCFVRGDRTRVKQVLINLLSNAIKYNSAQGMVEVSLDEGVPGRIRVSIRDTGAGLNQEQMSQLFQAFNRLGQEKGITEGTGIGLVLSKRLVELMGGSIGMESTLGEGSVFWFELMTSAEAEISIETLETAPPQSQAMHAAILHTLLYVEDNPANMSLVEQILARQPNMHLLKATDGNSGIEIARTFQPEVIFMDINLPGISGIQALKILRDDPLTAHIPVIAVSGNAMPLDIEMGIKAGFLNYLTKPIKVDDFVLALAMAMEHAANRHITTGLITEE